jgi:hypothetical protein
VKKLLLQSAFSSCKQMHMTITISSNRGSAFGCGLSIDWMAVHLAIDGMAVHSPPLAVHLAVGNPMAVHFAVGNPLIGFCCEQPIDWMAVNFASVPDPLLVCL